ncbi:MAG: hypothetical protein FJ276_15570 [Planctomycetes bacterium]|nr:hypothetical protein [Planctomycetota bacterium]
MDEGSRYLPSEVDRGLRIEAICERYEEAWRSGQRPPIHAGLEEVEPSDRSELVKELLAREVEWRRRQGEQPSAAEYSDLLQGYASVVASVFSTVEGRDAGDHSTLAPRPSPTEPPLRIRCPRCRESFDLPEAYPRRTLDCPACGEPFGERISASTLPEISHQSDGPMPPARIGQYAMIAPLGRGAFGSVWLAQDTHLDKLVAVKIPRQGRLSDMELERFRGDARAAARVRHPHVVAVHEVGVEQGLVYIVSDYIEGESLAARLASSLPMTPRQAAQLCATIAGALAAVHEAGVIHRDLKPSNILIDALDQPHIVDFGLAKREESGPAMTVHGDLLGTPAYMSPEQAAGQGHLADRRADIYSLGTILFELLTGTVPFHGEREMLLQQVREDEPPRPRRLAREIPIDLETICLRCLEKEPHRRFATARELEQELQRYLRGEPVLSRPITSVARGWRWCRRNPAVAGLLTTVGTMLVLAVAGISAWLVSESRRARELETSNEQLAISNLDLAVGRARLALELGDWPTALATLDGIETPPVGRDVELLLLRYEALDMAAERQESRQLLEQLTQRDDLGVWERDVRLRELDQLTASRESNQHAEVEQLLSQLHSLELTAADREYVSAVGADHPDDLVRHLQAALARDPRHLLAARLLGPALLCTGRLEETVEFARSEERLRPLGFDATALRALAEAVLGRVDEANQTVTQLQQRLGDRATAGARDGYSQFTQVVGELVDILSRLPASQDGAAHHALRNLLQLKVDISDVHSLSFTELMRIGKFIISLSMAGDFHSLRVAPAIHDQFGWLPQVIPAVPGLLLGGSTNLAPVLEELVADQVEPQYELILALLVATERSDVSVASQQWSAEIIRGGLQSRGLTNSMPAFRVVGQTLLCAYSYAAYRLALKADHSDEELASLAARLERDLRSAHREAISDPVILYGLGVMSLRSDFDSLAAGYSLQLDQIAPDHELSARLRAEIREAGGTPAAQSPQGD